MFDIFNFLKKSKPSAVGSPKESDSVLENDIIDQVIKEDEERDCDTFMETASNVENIICSSESSNFKLKKTCTDLGDLSTGPIQPILKVRNFD